jgi:hypothetical protein
MSASNNKSDDVNAYLAQLDYPLKAEVETVREIIKSVNLGITEQVKWNAPSFSYKGAYLVTFNLRDPKRIRLVFHNSAIPHIKSAWLEGDYPDRRLAYLTSMDDVRAQKAELVRIIHQLIRAEDSK